MTRAFWSAAGLVATAAVLLSAYDMKRLGPTGTEDPFEGVESQQPLSMQGYPNPDAGSATPTAVTPLLYVGNASWRTYAHLLLCPDGTVMEFLGQSTPPDMHDGVVTGNWEAQGASRMVVRRKKMADVVIERGSESFSLDTGGMFDRDGKVVGKRVEMRAISTSSALLRRLWLMTHWR